MELTPVWILAVLNVAIVTCLMTSDLTCSQDNVGIDIDINGYEPRGFRFPMTGTFGFPASSTCKWNFKTQEGLRFALGITDMKRDPSDVITLQNTLGTTLPIVSSVVGMKEGFRMVTSTGNAISVLLETDSSSNDEEMYIYVIAGIDSETCPGTSTVSATDTSQIITSSNFPDNYENNEVCDITITADENKTLSYSIVFQQLDDLNEFAFCYDVLEVFDGSTFENKIFDTCNSYFPTRLSEVKSKGVGRTLNLRFVTDNVVQYSGFVVSFKQEDVNECLEKDCNPNNACIVPDSMFECECNRNDATCTEKRSLFCPNGGSEVIIDVPEFESQVFSFQPEGSDGFPISTTCTWTFRGEEGSNIIIKAYDITLEGPDRLVLKDETGSDLDVFDGPLRNFIDGSNQMASSNLVKVTLTTDNQASNMEGFKVALISGRDSGTCPGSSTIQATNSLQTITSARFPKLNRNEMCDVTITADEGMVVVFSFVFLEFEGYRDDCDDILTVSAENELFRSCLSYQSAINTQTTGNSLRLRYSISDRTDDGFGFVLRFRQKAVEECSRDIPRTDSGVCDSNAVCINTDGSFECECKDDFVSNGFECVAPTTTPFEIRKKNMLPLYLAWSLGTTVSGAMLLILLYKMADAPKIDKW